MYETHVDAHSSFHCFKWVKDDTRRGVVKDAQNRTWGLLESPDSLPLRKKMALIFLSALPLICCRILMRTFYLFSGSWLQRGEAAATCFFLQKPHALSPLAKTTFLALFILRQFSLECLKLLYLTASLPFLSCSGLLGLFFPEDGRKLAYLIQRPAFLSNYLPLATRLKTASTTMFSLAHLEFIAAQMAGPCLCPDWGEEAQAEKLYYFCKATKEEAFKPFYRAICLLEKTAEAHEEVQKILRQWESYKIGLQDPQNPQLHTSLAVGVVNATYQLYLLNYKKRGISPQTSA